MATGVTFFLCGCEISMLSFIVCFLIFFFIFLNSVSVCWWDENLKINTFCSDRQFGQNLLNRVFVGSPISCFFLVISRSCCLLLQLGFVWNTHTHTHTHTQLLFKKIVLCLLTPFFFNLFSLFFFFISPRLLNFCLFLISFYV